MSNALHRIPTITISYSFMAGRDPDYNQLNVKFTIDVVKAALVINRFPDVLKPCVLPAERIVTIMETIRK